MTTPVTITAVRLDISHPMVRPRLSRCKVSVEINGEWVEVINEGVSQDDIVVSHTCQGDGILNRLEAA